MAAFLGISVWITLATVFPGLITIALLYGAAWIIDPGLLASETSGPLSGWAYPGIAVTIMVLTQALGILLESVLVGGRLLGPELERIRVPAGVDPCGEELIELRPYLDAGASTTAPHVGPPTRPQRRRTGTHRQSLGAIPHLSLSRGGVRAHAIPNEGSSAAHPGLSG